MTTEAGAPGAAQDLLQRPINERFSTLLADPPWQFQNRTGKVAPEHRRLNRYATMTLNDIKALPIGQISADTAHLYLWVPNALLPEGLAVMMAWGFQYKANTSGTRSEKTAAPVAAASVSISATRPNWCCSA